MELTENNLVLFLKKLECSSQLGRISVVKPYITLVGEVCKTNLIQSYCFDPLSQMKWTQCAQEDEEHQQTADITDKLTQWSLSLPKVSLEILLRSK